MPSEIDGVKLQLAMAFGQGAGAMLATADAIDRLLEQKGGILENAMRDWNASRWAFIQLVRTLGQVSAAHAAGTGSAQIQWTDIEAALPGILILCPCVFMGTPSARRA
jgi:hypothetical protein